jgi:hypothetical protein
VVRNPEVRAGSIVAQDDILRRTLHKLWGCLDLHRFGRPDIRTERDGYNLDRPMPSYFRQHVQESDCLEIETARGR